MIPILYNGDETRFITNGVGRLSSCTRAVVTEERNGIYELEFDIPISGERFDEIERGMIVACTHDDRQDIQPFKIYGRSVPDLNGIVTFYAHHISYKLSDVVVMPFTAGSAAAALQGISDNSINANPFTFWTDKVTVADYKNDVPRIARNMLGGEENSILDVFGGGEYEFDLFDVKLYEHRGTDTDVEIRYSKNLISLNETTDDSGSYNAVVPFWTDSEGRMVTLPEGMLIFEGTEPQTAYLTDHNLIIIRTETNEPIEVAYEVVDAAPMDLSDAFEEAPTEAELREAARSRFERSKAWLPSENLEVDFIQLWQTEEFEEYAALQRVRLCDTVSVYYPAAGIEKVKQKVVKTEYNVLQDRYDSITLGEMQTSLGQAIQTQIMENVPTKSMMDAAIQYATDLIRGGLGGYVIMTPGPDGYPQEILIMDTPDTATAVNVWRFNQGGLGHSSNGYNGPFSDIALTQDGKINASMITTGILNANVIKAGIISDDSGMNSWNLDSGQFNTKQGSIGKFTINDEGLSYGKTILADSSGFLTTKTATSGRLGTKLSGGNITFWASDGGLEISDMSQFAYIATGSVGTPSTGYTHNLSLGFTGEGSLLRAAADSLLVYKDLSVLGTKSRISRTVNYSDRLLYCYETPTPLFGDIGEAVIDSDGLAYVDVDDIFSETIADRVEYQVFLQREGEGDCYIAEKTPRYFVIKGTPALKVAWELKAKQKDYEALRLEQPESGLDEYEHIQEDSLAESYINEQEELLYG